MISKEEYTRTVLNELSLDDALEDLAQYHDIDIEQEKKNMIDEAYKQFLRESV